MTIKKIIHSLIFLSLIASILMASNADELKEKLSSAKTRYQKKLQSHPDKADKYYASQLSRLMKWADKSELSNQALEIARQIIAISPDHIAARKRAGFKKHEGHWFKEIELKKQLEAGNIYSEKFDWVAPGDLKHLKKGEIRIDGKWMTEEDANKAHSAWDKAWQLESTHWKITSNYKYSYIQNCLKLIESEYDLFRKVFKNCLKNEGKIDKKMEVFIYKNRKEYLVKVKEIDDGMSVNSENTGFFDTGTNTSYFYYSPPDPDEDRAVPLTIATLKHECCHQLFFKLCGMYAHDKAPSFWAEEGIACVMETFVVDDKGKASLPGLDQFKKSDWFRSYVYLKDKGSHFEFTDLATTTSTKFWKLLEDSSKVELGQSFYAGSTILSYYFMQDSHKKKLSTFLKQTMLELNTKKNLFTETFDKPEQVEKDMLTFYSID